MKKFKSILRIFLVVCLLASMTTAVYAADPITIDSVIFEKYDDGTGVEDKNLINVKLTFTTVTQPEEVTLLITTEDLTELSETTKSKILYITQDVRPTEEVLEYVIERSRMKTATGLNDVDGIDLYVKMGGMNVDTMAKKTVTFVDPYEADLVPGDADGDGEVTNLDATLLLRYLNDWDVELK